MSEEILVFSYFKGHGDGLHLAASVDGYRWQPLADDHILLKPETGIEKIMRDPCLILGRDDQFHLVWTCGWTERGIGYASSSDLHHWNDQQYLPVMEHQQHARNCWAPEIFYDEPSDKYIIYWASTVDGLFPETQPFGDNGYNHRMYYVTTADFKSFSETRLLYDPGFNVIDANIVADGNRYLLFMKNETLVPPQKNIRVASGNSPYSFGPASDALTPNHYWAEGPTGIFTNGEWLVYFDKYKINQMGMIRSRDLRNWEDASHVLEFPKGAQHGYVTRVPAWRIKQLLNRTEMAAGSQDL